MKRKVFITGASSGIGKAIAYAFAKEGDDLLLCARRVDKLAAIKEDIEGQYPVKVSTFPLDVSLPPIRSSPYIVIVILANETFMFD